MTHLGCSSLLHSIQELLQVAALQGFCGLGAGQDGHEVVHCRLQVPVLPVAAPQSVVNVLLYEAPGVTSVHAQRLSAKHTPLIQCG